MKKIIIYTTSTCPYCVKAKALLNAREMKYTEFNVENELLRKKMIKKTNGCRTVPQIFINDQHIGGYEELYALDKDKKL